MKSFAFHQRRRFGAVGLFVESSYPGYSGSMLGHVAHRPVSHEIKFAFAPGFVCIGIGLLLFAVARIQFQFSMLPAEVLARTVAPLAIEFLDESAPAPAPAVATRELPPASGPAPALLPTPPIPTELNDALAASPPDFTAPPLAPLPSTGRITDEPATHVMAARTEPRRPGSISTARVFPRPTELDQPNKLPSALSLATDAPSEITAGPPRNPSRFRPSARNAYRSAGPSAAIPSLATSRALRPSPDAFSDPTEKFTSASRRVRGAPAVSAAAPGRAALESIASGLEAANSSSRHAGWQEVPLDSLPDCSPAGRQDTLKLEIIAATRTAHAATLECRAAGGGFRFVPSRNLGSFLMWTQGQPLSTHRGPRPRDACMVLEAALRCLAIDRSVSSNVPADKEYLK